MKPSKNLVYLLFILLFLYSGCCKKSTSTDLNKDKAFNISYESKSKLPDCYELDSILRDFDIELVDCPAGTFMMGSPADEVGRDKKDEFQHQVTITKPYRIGKYEITLDQFEKITGRSLIKKEGDNEAFKFIDNRKKSNDEDLNIIFNKKVIPCICTCNEANEFCQKLNIRFSEYIPKNYHFDLPTEAQWEYACRAGTTTAFNNGKNISSIDPNERKWFDSECVELNDIAWYGFNSRVKKNGKDFGYKIKPIGTKKNNDWGIYDMHGNVPEYCKDRYGPYSSKNNVDPYIDRGGPPVIRGGGFNLTSKNCRSASRKSAPSFDFPAAGFRIVLVSND